MRDKILNLGNNILNLDNDILNNAPSGLPSFPRSSILDDNPGFSPLRGVSPGLPTGSFQRRGWVDNLTGDIGIGTSPLRHNGTTPCDVSFNLHDGIFEAKDPMGVLRGTSRSLFREI